MQLLKTFVVLALAATGLAAVQADPKHPGGCPDVGTCDGRVRLLSLVLFERSLSYGTNC